MPVITFEEGLEASNGRPRSILLGNGFSIAQSGAEFSYANLLERSGLADGSSIRNVFDVLGTTDFEEVMHALEHAATVEQAYGDNAKAEQFNNDAAEVREALIRAIHTVHPGIQFDIPAEQMTACAQFLQHFGTVFSLNYDLLLYWTILNSEGLRLRDGFGRGETVDGFRTFQTDADCNVYHPHGALHLFLGRQQEAKKRVRTGDTIIDDIENTIRRENQLPLFVAEGTRQQKIAKINSVPYLRHSYNQLKETDGSLFVFGHSASDNDVHIYRAIFLSRVTDLFFCVHDPDNNLDQIEEQLAPHIRERADINIHYVSSETANVWGAA